MPVVPLRRTITKDGPPLPFYHDRPSTEGAPNDFLTFGLTGTRARRLSVDPFTPNDFPETGGEWGKGRLWLAKESQVMANRRKEG